MQTKEVNQDHPKTRKFAQAGSVDKTKARSKGTKNMLGKKWTPQEEQRIKTKDRHSSTGKQERICAYPGSILKLKIQTGFSRTMVWGWKGGGLKKKLDNSIHHIVLKW